MSSDLGNLANLVILLAPSLGVQVLRSATQLLTVWIQRQRLRPKGQAPPPRRPGGAPRPTTSVELVPQRPPYKRSRKKYI
jgi:hypothetical protein